MNDEVEAVVSEEAAVLNEMADAALEVPPYVLNRSARNDDEVFSLAILRNLAMARAQRVNIGDHLIRTLQGLREEADLDGPSTSD